MVIFTLSPHEIFKKLTGMQPDLVDILAFCLCTEQLRDSATGTMKKSVFTHGQHFFYFFSK